MNKGKVSHVELLFRTYTAFSIGCAVVWAARLAVVAAEASEDTGHALILVFLDGCSVVVGHQCQGRVSAATEAAADLRATR
jgi:hypothetical protein